MFNKKTKVDLAGFTRPEPWWKTTLWGREYIANEVVVSIAILSLILGFLLGGLAALYVIKAQKPVTPLVTKKPAVTSKQIVRVPDSQSFVPKIELKDEPEANEYLVPEIVNKG